MREFIRWQLRLIKETTSVESHDFFLWLERKRERPRQPREILWPLEFYRL